MEQNEAGKKNAFPFDPKAKGKGAPAGKSGGKGAMKGGKNGVNPKMKGVKC